MVRIRRRLVRFGDGAARAAEGVGPYEADGKSGAGSPENRRTSAMVLRGTSRTPSPTSFIYDNLLW